MAAKDVLMIENAPSLLLKKLKNVGLTVHRADQTPDPVAWLQESGKSIKYVLTNGHRGLPKEYAPHLPSLKVISSNGVGYDGIDTDSAVANGVIVTHTPNVLNAETSTTAIMLMLASYRNLLSCDRHVRSGAWETQGAHPLERTPDNRKVGILGMGRIGQAIAKKLLAFDSTVVYHSRTKKDDLPYEFYDDLLKMAKDVDCLIVIVPGGPATKHMVNEDVMNALGPEGTLINVARGTVVDEGAMIKALEEKRLGRAGLDVFENEPDVPLALREMDNVVLMPHAGSATIETRAAMIELAVENILQFEKNGTVISPVPECAHLAARN